MCVFSDPNGHEGVLAAGEYGVWRLAYGQEPQRIGFPAGVSIGGDVEFIQAFDRVIMLRGYDLTPLVWNPRQTFAGGLGEFEEIAEAGSGTGDFIEVIPNSVSGVEFNGRLYLQYGRDQIAVSDVYDYTHYDPVFGAFRLNEGSDDRIVVLLPFGDTRLIVFKDQSIELVGGLYGDLGDARGDIVTRERGAVARHSVCYAGSSVIFLSEGGVYELAQTGEANLQLVPVPLSESIQPVIDRINRAYAGGACAAVDGDRYYLAVPVDGEIFNNVILVYNFALKAWEGEWTADFLDVKRFVRADHGGQRRLFVLNGSGDESCPDANGALLLCGSGMSDAVCGESYDISAELLTRGYSAGPGRNRTKALYVSVSGWRPSYELFLVTGGVSEEKAVSGTIEPGNTQYLIHGKADWDETNVDDDHAEAYREDYSAGTERVKLRNGMGAVCGTISPAYLKFEVQQLAEISEKVLGLADDWYVDVVDPLAGPYEGTWRIVAGTESDWVDGALLLDAGSRNWIDVAMSDDGTRIVAAVYGGYLYVSADSGDTWTEVASSQNWKCVASSADGMKLVAGVSMGYIYTSVDAGVTWTSKIYGYWHGVASSADGMKLVAVGTTFTGSVFTSADGGETWTEREEGLPDHSITWRGVASSANGTILLVHGNEYLYVSTDSGETWTARGLSANWYGAAMSDDGMKMAACAYLSGGTYTSDDMGVTWTARDLGNSGHKVEMSADGTMLAQFIWGSGIYCSQDLGETWTFIPSINIYNMAMSADGMMLVLAEQVAPGSLYKQYTFSVWEYYCECTEAEFDAAEAFGDWHVRDIDRVGLVRPLWLGENGIDFGVFQNVEKRYRVRANGGFFQMRMVNGRGAVKLHRTVAEQINGGGANRKRV